MHLTHLFSVLILGVSMAASAGDFGQAESFRIQGNHSKALSLYVAAAAGGHPASNHWAGIYYFEGFGVDRNAIEAAKYFLAGARMGVKGSMVYLATIYLKGEGLPKDCERAKYWITRATRGNIGNDWKTKLRSCA